MPPESCDTPLCRVPSDRLFDEASFAPASGFSAIVFNVADDVGEMDYETGTLTIHTRARAGTGAMLGPASVLVMTKRRNRR
jgi:hypothetical protein